MNAARSSRVVPAPGRAARRYNRRVRLLVVEDEHRLADRLARGLREEGFAVDTASTTALARDLASGADYDLVLLDLKLPDGSGIELLGSGARRDSRRRSSC